jgi:integrase
VTVLNGHIHQIMQKVEGAVTFHTARSTAFLKPAPGTAPSPPEGARGQAAQRARHRHGGPGSAIFTRGERPRAGGGEAAFWLPLLGLFTGARLNELAPLTAADITRDEATGIACINIKEVLEQGRPLKTEGSARVLPVHPELIRIGFLRFTDEIASSSGPQGRLFPLLKPGPKDGFGEAWSKWFGRFKRALGITNKDSVFHSFRHGLKDALRRARVGEDVNDALTGHSNATIGRSYGARDMVRRFGLETLADAVSKVAYPGLDLSNIRWDGNPGGR